MNDGEFYAVRRSIREQIENKGQKRVEIPAQYAMDMCDEIEEYRVLLKKLAHRMKPYLNIPDDPA